MERIVIVDHGNHRAFIEDIDEEILEKKYNGEEEEYIKDNYELSDLWSWDFVTGIEYTSNDGKTIDVEPSEWL